MKKIFTVFLTTILLLSLFCIPVQAAEVEFPPVTEEILQAQMKKANVTSVQALIDYHADRIGDGFEWYVMTFALCDLPYDYENYCASLLRHVEDNPVTNPVTREKYALTLLSCGYTADFVEKTKDDTHGKLGTMSYIFSLHLANFGYVPSGMTLDDVVDSVLALQNQDGGFSLEKGPSDVDVTAMALQALIAHYDRRQDVKTVVDTGVLLLSKWQNENGSYASGNVENPESAAQTVITLSSLGIDVLTDARFVKNGNTVVDSMLSFEKKSGEYAHTHDSLANGASTRQVFLADMAMWKMQTNSKNFFAPTTESPVFLKPKAENIPEETTTTKTATPTETEDGKTEVTPTKKGPSYKIYVIVGTVSAAFVASAVLLLLKKKNVKHHLTVWLIAILGIAIVLLTDFESKSSYYEDTTGGKAVGTVTVSISCDTLVGKYESKYIPSDGVILPPVSIAIYENDTAYTVLQRAAKQHQIQMEVSGGGDMLYVEGIAYLYELQYGDYSGWMYAVNGKSASVGCNQYPVKDGDVISWDYTRDLGHDLSYS